ncbi:MAG: ion transporter [Spirochaetales bacterium]|nr:ion transporter [Spirochaetales bacterium]
MKIRKRLFEIIEISTGNDLASSIYDYFMIVVILFSLVPLAFKRTTTALNVMDKVTVTVFLVDYIFRLFTADYKLKKGWVSFILYPFTFMALIDIVCILPSFTPLHAGFRILKIFRLLRSFRVIRAAKMLRYSKSLVLVADVIREQKSALIAVCLLSISYVLLSALVIFNVEPDTFGNFFDAVYWATVSLATIGYGDIYPVSTAGRVITIISSFLGVAIIALPAGIITAGFMDKLNEKQKAEK